MRLAPWKRGVVLSSVIVAILCVAGCSAPNTSKSSVDPRALVLQAEDDLRSIGATANADALADGSISYDEYLEAAGRYQSCLRDFGMVFDGPYLSPVDNVWLLWSPPEDLSDGPDRSPQIAECDASWRPLAAAYIDTHESRMDDALRDAVAQCMADFPLTGEEKSVIDFMGAVEDTKTDRMEAAERCITAEQQRIYPDLPGVTILY